MHFLLSQSSFVLLYTDSKYSSKDNTPHPHTNSTDISLCFVSDDYNEGSSAYKDEQTLPNDLLVVWGLSPTYLAALLAVAVTAIQVPWLLGLLRLPGHMPPIGSDSRAIAAACHVSPLAKAPLNEETGEKGEGYEPVLMAEEEGNSGLVAVSRSLLSWGVVEMPQAWYDAHVDRRDGLASRRAVGHLSFGTTLDVVKRPIRGRFYA